VKHRYRAQFRLLTVVQVLLLGVSMALLVWALFATDHVAVPLIVAIVVLLQVFLLIRYVESHVDTLEEFFASINYEDFTRRFVEDDVDAELKESFNRVLRRFQDARADRDMQADYLETVIRHVPVPFLAAKSDGSFSFVNNPARRLLGITPLRHIDQLAVFDESLPEKIRAIPSGHQQLLQTRIHQVPAELRVSVSEIRMRGEIERLYSLENLSGELTAREASAWRNLIRVLTHEIMNTLTPITSLAQTAVTMLDKPAVGSEIRAAIETIARRSDGLTSFVSRYRELLKVPQPVPVDVRVDAALQDVVALMREPLAACEVVIDVVPQSLEVRADKPLLDQVLLNLVRNAIDAMSSQPSPSLRLEGHLDAGRVIIAVTDNGDGIDEQTIEQIFIPFFTTKRDGSGIGLSLCRQIMTAHGGDISVQTGAGGTTMRLIF
jgi:nitrogen fixation/metabolism regulation signal transduction histidine kinase